MDPLNRPERRETDWMWNELNSLRLDMKEQHQRFRSDMNAGFMKIAHEIGERVAPLERRAEDHSGRLLTIEVERRGEAAQALKRGTWAGILAASGVQAFLKAVEHVWK